MQILKDFGMLVPEEYGKQNPQKSYTNKYKKNIACSYRL